MKLKYSNHTKSNGRINKEALLFLRNYFIQTHKKWTGLLDMCGRKIMR